MRKREFDEAVKAIAVESGLRKVIRKHRPGQYWVGIHRGIFVTLHLDSMRLEAKFTSPEPEIGSASDDLSAPDEGAAAGMRDVERKEASEAFTHCARLGISSDWFDQAQIGDWGFVLTIDRPRWSELRRANLDGLLDGVAADLHQLGAEESKPCCQCAAPAATLAYIENFGAEPLVAPYCSACFDELKQSTRGVVQKAPPKQRLLAWMVLGIGVLAMAAAWGFAQHPELGVPIHFLIIGCAAAGIGLAALTMGVAQGSDLWLRLGVTAGVMLATLAGNVIGVKLLSDANEGQIDWTRIGAFYFQQYLPKHVGQEILFLVGGIAGVVFGFWLMRESERTRIQ
jgi:hypothetical protein